LGAPQARPEGFIRANGASQRSAALLFHLGVGTAGPFFLLPKREWSAGRRQGFARPLVVPGISSEHRRNLA